MLNQKPIPQQLKLYIIFIVFILFTLIFLYLFLSPKVSYFFELYSYRQDLLDRLNSSEVKKPILKQTDPYWGNPRAKIIIFEYGDFGCKACSVLQPSLDQITDFYGKNNIFVVWKDMPISTSSFSQQAHQAARCAHEQNEFFQYKKGLYENQNKFDELLFSELAKNLNLDLPLFENCLKTQKYKPLINENLRDGLALGIDGTPTLFINNVEVISGFTFENLRNIIEKTK